MEKTFSTRETEERIHDRWMAGNCFRAGNSGRPPFCIVIPPPNVTGSLHIGHALTFTLQDILVRWNRAGGKDVLWQPGLDHAGIATQSVVERQLGQEGSGRAELGRKAFVRRVREWSDASARTINGQLRRLGASCDWERSRFTMDDGFSRAVRMVFVRLFQEGLIHRQKRLVNWDPALGTAVSDLEVVSREVPGKFWYIRYPLGDGRHITVATTRPETIPGDVAVAVHPGDERYREMIGLSVQLPLCGRSIPVIADSGVDPDAGSGALKITPAHDFTDFGIGQRHGLPQLSVFDGQARLNDAAPAAFRGMERYQARKAIVAALESAGLVEKVGDIVHQVPFSDRSGVPVEPRLTDQWFVDSGALAGPAIAAVEREDIRFVPRQWENTYFEWMRNIQPWCISRQIWWGHRIPAWYGPDGRIFVAMDSAGAHADAARHYGADTPLRQDEDVLDTWFSSALWPFATLGWPGETAETMRYYPTSVLVTGFDIIFFWVARMIMMGLHITGQIPFRTVCVHALVRDAEGQKMSKSKGNIVDPLELVDRHGADALRFALAALASPGRDVRLSEKRLEGYRNFMTKLWNAGRFVRMNGCLPVAGLDSRSFSHPLNRGMAGMLVAAARETGDAIDACRFDECAETIYHLSWRTFCDWYLELVRPLLGDEGAGEETRAAVGWNFSGILHLLHPLAPFITEELYDKALGQTGLLASAQRPDFQALPEYRVEREEVAWLIDLVSTIRSVRSATGVPPATRLRLLLADASPRMRERAARYDSQILRLARLESIGEGDVPGLAARIPCGEGILVLPLGGIIDAGKERRRLAGSLGELRAGVAKIRQQLDSPDFVARAPGDIVGARRERLAELEERIRITSQALDMLAQQGPETDSS